MGATRYFEEFKIGESVTSRSRMMDTADIRMFGACTSLCHRIHTDALYCAKIPRIKKPIIPFSLLLNVIDAFFAQSVSPDGIPTFHYGYDKVEYKKPIYPGDSVYTKFELVDKQEKNENFGVLTLHATTYNQDGEIVVFHVDKLYVGRKPKNN